MSESVPAWAAWVPWVSWVSWPARLIAVAVAFAMALALAPPPARAQAPAPEPPQIGLPDALKELEARSPSLAQARSRADEASGLVRQAQAQLLPALTLSGAYTRNSDVAPPGAGSLLLNFAIQPLEAWSASAGARVPLAIPSAWADLAAARHGAAAAEAGAQAARLSLRLALVQGAWLSAAAEEIVAAAQRALDVAREQTRTAKRAVEAGLQPPLSALASETQSVRREGDLVRARSALEGTRLALGVLLGRDGPVRVALGPPSPAPAGDPAALASEALSRRPEVAAQAEQVAAAESQITAARLHWLPQLALTGSATAQDVPLPSGKKDGWRVVVELSWPLLEGGLREGQRQEAQARAAGARAAAEGQRLSIVQEVEDAAREVEVAREQLRLAGKRQWVAADAAATAKRGFEAGTTGNVDVLQANDDLFQAEVALADARARLGGAAAALDRAVGRL